MVHGACTCWTGAFTAPDDININITFIYITRLMCTMENIQYYSTVQVYSWTTVLYKYTVGSSCNEDKRC